MDQNNILKNLIPKLIYNIINNKHYLFMEKVIIPENGFYVKDHCEALLKFFKKEELENFTILVLIKILTN